jgi:hypothetical protein
MQDLQDCDSVPARGTPRPSWLDHNFLGGGGSRIELQGGAEPLRKFELNITLRRGGTEVRKEYKTVE